MQKQNLNDKYRTILEIKKVLYIKYLLFGYLSPGITLTSTRRALVVWRCFYNPDWIHLNHFRESNVNFQAWQRLVSWK